MSLEVVDAAPEALLGLVASRLPLGFRFVTMTCLDVPDGFQILYHFDRDFQLETIRVALKEGEAAPSISPVFEAAALVENEIQDLFGVRFTGLTLDYEGRLLLSQGAPKAPMRKDRADAPPEGKKGEEK